MFVLVPLLCMNFITATVAWVQHAFTIRDSPDSTRATHFTLRQDHEVRGPILNAEKRIDARRGRNGHARAARF